MWAVEEAKGSGAQLLGGDRAEGPRRSRKTPRPRLFLVTMLKTRSRLHQDARSIPHLHQAISTHASDSFESLLGVFNLKENGAGLSNYRLIEANGKVAGRFFLWDAAMQLLLNLTSKQYI